MPTGVAIALPEGYVAFVHPRSGLAARHGLSIVNTPGTIDAGYRGEIKVLLINHDRREPVELHRGDRIAQLVVQRFERAASSRSRPCRTRCGAPGATVLPGAPDPGDRHIDVPPQAQGRRASVDPDGHETIDRRRVRRRRGEAPPTSVGPVRHRRDPTTRSTGSTSGRSWSLPSRAPRSGSRWTRDGDPGGDARRHPTAHSSCAPSPPPQRRPVERGASDRRRRSPSGVAPPPSGRAGSAPSWCARCRSMPDGSPAMQPSRIVGVNGPRWLLRATFLGGPPSSRRTRDRGRTPWPRSSYAAAARRWRPATRCRSCCRRRPAPVRQVLTDRPGYAGPMALEAVGAAHLQPWASPQQHARDLRATLRPGRCRPDRRGPTAPRSGCAARCAR